MPNRKRPTSAAARCGRWSPVRPARSAAWAADDPKSVFDDFPLAVEGPVYYCGFNSPKSYGGNSYFVRHPAGNWLIDSPKFLPRLVRRLEALGGIANIFLTHRDDVADADRYARHFGSQRFIHRAELASQPDAEVVLEGHEPQPLAERISSRSRRRATPPGTGAAVRRAFSVHRRPSAFRPRPAAAGGFGRLLLALLAAADRVDGAGCSSYSFEWVLPGHGQRVHLPADEMHGSWPNWSSGCEPSAGDRALTLADGRAPADSI